jgi:two-component system C4-dicarboxylate transport response regulator DctD
MTDPQPRILVVDDDAAVLRMMAEALELRGFTPRPMQSSRDAAKLLRTETFDLIITDVVMPYVHGLEILQIAKSRKPETPVLFVTGHAHRQIIKEGLIQGAYAFLEKPFNLPDFIATVERALSHGREAAR